MINFGSQLKIASKMKKLTLILLFISSILISNAQDITYSKKSDIAYYDKSVTASDAYAVQQCVLDLYYPDNIKGYPTIVWFHGGGLQSGDKFIPAGLLEQGVAVVAVKYRLNPKVKAPVYIEDAAAAVAWTFKNIGSYGGDASLIFVSGHSAGGYLTSMVGMDKKWLKAHDIDANKIAGLIPFSGQCITHSTVREEQGIDVLQPTIGELAPVYHVRPDAPPLLLITGDRNLEIKARYAENYYMETMMKAVGHKDTRLLEIQGYGHGMVEPAVPILLREVKRIVEKSN